MSGHNKWSKIKHKKATTDAAKSKVFSKLVKLIQVEAKAANGDVSSPNLRAAIEKARKENMPNENIQRAIKKASESGDVALVVFEAYGPGGVGIIIEALTENNNRTNAEIKYILSKNGTTLAGPNAVSWNFSRDPETRDWVPNSTLDLDDYDLEKLSNLVDLLEENDDVQEIYTNAA